MPYDMPRFSHATIPPHSMRPSARLTMRYDLTLSLMLLPRSWCILWLPDAMLWCCMIAHMMMPHISHDYRALYHIISISINLNWWMIILALLSRDMICNDLSDIYLASILASSRLIWYDLPPLSSFFFQNFSELHFFQKFSKINFF